MLYNQFLTNTLNAGPPRVIAELVSFAETFEDLLNTSEDDFDDFVTRTHSSNSARTAANKLLIPNSAIVSLKALMFELKDRETCNALPDRATLQAMNGNSMRVLRTQHNTAKEQAKGAKQAKLSDSMKVVKLTQRNYQEFETSFRALATRTIGTRGITLDYMMRESDGNYATVWISREEKLKNCATHNGPQFLSDSALLYNLYVEHIGSTGVGSDIIQRNKTRRNGHKCYLDLHSHFQSDAYLQNRANIARANIKKAAYGGNKKHFTIQNYYDIFSKAFNDMDYAGPVHSLNEVQKVNAFQQGLQETNAIRFSMQAKGMWDLKPANEQTFDSYYNEFSTLLSTFDTLNNTTPTYGNPHRRIGATHTDDDARSQGRGRGGRATGRGRGGRFNGRGGGRFGRGGRSNGRGRSFNPYSMNRRYGAFTPEAKIYEFDEWRTLSRDDRNAVATLKAQQGWTDGNTPPPGYQISRTGFAEPSTSIVNAVQSVIAATSTAPLGHMPHTPALPPVPGTQLTPPVPPIITTDPQTAGQSFGRRGTRVPSSQDSASIGMVSINGQIYNRGPVFDENGNRLS